MQNARVAVVHYWFVSDRGGESVVRSILELFPDADVFTHVIDPVMFAGLVSRHRVRESFIGRLPGARRHYQKLLPLMPLALEQLDLRGYDLVISSDSGPAKGVLVDSGTVHVCYCHSPMRYLWDMYQDYREGAGRLTRLCMPWVTHYLRLWDQHSANRVDCFVANSEFVRRRIGKIYRRDACVVHPPVDVERFAFHVDKDDYFVVLGQLTAYKRPDIAVEAFVGMPQRRLVVIGEGEMLSGLRRIDAPNITFTGRLSGEQANRYLERARALVFPGVEDFGIVPVEALACGTPVIAYAKGGILETVSDEETGILYHDNSAQGLRSAVDRFEEWEPTMDRAMLRGVAQAFSREHFKQAFRAAVAGAWMQQHSG